MGHDALRVAVAKESVLFGSEGVSMLKLADIKVGSRLVRVIGNMEAVIVEVAPDWVTLELWKRGGTKCKRRIRFQLPKWFFTDRSCGWRSEDVSKKPKLKWWISTGKPPYVWVLSSLKEYTTREKCRKAAKAFIKAHGIDAEYVK